MTSTSSNSVSYPFAAAPLVYEPPAEYRTLRQRHSICPIAYRDSGQRAWLAVDYDSVRTVLTDPAFSRAAAAAEGVPTVGVGRLGFEALLGVDPPEHTRLRQTVARTFSRQRAEEMRGEIRRLACGLASSMFSSPPPADLVSGFSLPLALRVICDVMGIPPGDEEFLRYASTVLASRSSRNRSEVNAQFTALYGYFHGLISIGEANPHADLLAALRTACAVDGTLSLDEAVKMAISLLVVGHETSTSMIALFVVTLLDHPVELQRLREDASLVPNAVEELLRFIPISDGAGALVRVALRDVKVADHVVTAGEAVIPAVPAANRDPGRFPNADVLDLARKPGKILTFGGGHHFCLGAALARVELQEALAALMSYLPGQLRLAVDRSELMCEPSASVRRLRELPLHW